MHQYFNVSPTPNTPKKGIIHKILQIENYRLLLVVFLFTQSYGQCLIVAMISAGGLGEVVLKGITQMNIGLGFEGGISVVILAIVLDRITQGMAQRKKR